MATITGTQGRDVLNGTGGADSIYGLGGGDTLFGSAGSDRLDGGDGSDTVDYSRLTGSVQVDLGAGWTGKGQGGADTLVSIGNVVGSASGDTLWGNGNENLIQGGRGNDNLWGGAGNDTLDGGDGSDRVDYSGSPSGVIVDLAAGTASDGYGGTDRIVSVGHAGGSAQGDILYGTSDVNQLAGWDGNDKLYGRAGDDVLQGGEGDDLLDGGAGNDRISYLGDPAGVTVNLGAGTATDGWGDHDTIVSVGFVTGTADHADVLIGNNSDNRLEGVGGANTLTGLGGADTFATSSWDWWGGTTVTDFQHGVDKLLVDLHSTPVTGYSAGALAGSRFTTGTPDGTNWTFTYDQSTGVVGFDIDGSGPDAAMTVITLDNHPTLSASDFLLA